MRDFSKEIAEDDAAFEQVDVISDGDMKEPEIPEGEEA